MYTSSLLIRRVIACAMALGVIAAIGACSSQPNTPTTVDETVPKSPATGAEVHVWAIAPMSGVVAVPQVAAGAKAAFRYINDHGGLGKDHNRVVLKECDTQMTPQGEIQCAQQAADDPLAIAAVSPLVVLATQQVTTMLQNAGLPNVGGLTNTPADFVNPINFPLTTTNFGTAACAVTMARATKTQKVGFASADIPVSVSVTNDGIAAATKAGLKPVGPVTFPVSTADVTPFVSQLAAQDPDTTVLTGAPANVNAWLASSARLGRSQPTCVIDGSVPRQVLTGLGQQAKNFYAAAFLPDVSWTGYPLLANFRSQAQAEVADGDKAASLDTQNNTEMVLLSWVSTQAIAQAAANVDGTLDRAGFLAALNRTTVTFGDGEGALLPAIDFATPNADARYTRLFNTTYFLKRWDPDKQTFERVRDVAVVHGDKLLP